MIFLHFNKEKKKNVFENNPCPPKQKKKQRQTLSSLETQQTTPLTRNYFCKRKKNLLHFVKAKPGKKQNETQNELFFFTFCLLHSDETKKKKKSDQVWKEKKTTPQVRQYFFPQWKNFSLFWRNNVRTKRNGLN